MNVISTLIKRAFSVVSLLIFASFYSTAIASEPTAETEFGKVLDPLIEKKLLPGYHFAVYKGGERVFVRSEGFADQEANIAADENTLYAIASMSKPIVTLALLTLMESTDVGLSDPVSKYLPEFSDMLVAEGGSYDTQLTPANRQITIYDLLTHTSGFTYSSDITGRGDIANAYRDLEIFSLRSSVESEIGDLAAHTAKLSELPLVTQPGARFTYSVGIDVAGRVIEVVSGKNLREYLQDHIFIPLGMTDTDFEVDSDDEGRLARLYSPLKRTYQIPGIPKMYQKTDLLPDGIKNIGQGSAMYSGGAGLISTAADYAKFMNFLLRRSDDNALLLGQDSFDLMLTDQLGKTLGPNLMAPTMGNEASNQVFSIGLGIFLEDEAESLIPKNYDYLGWSGAYNTHFWIDPKSQVAGIFMTQIFPPVYSITDQLENVADQFFAD